MININITIFTKLSLLVVVSSSGILRANADTSYAVDVAANNDENANVTQSRRQTNAFLPYYHREATASYQRRTLIRKHEVSTFMGSAFYELMNTEVAPVDWCWCKHCKKRNH